MKSLKVQQGPKPNIVRNENGDLLTAPSDWELLPPGDAALTRRVKTATDHWVVEEKKGRRTFSKGVWASSAIIAKTRRDLSIQRQKPSHVKKQKAAADRREKVQTQYVDEFCIAVKNYLQFNSRYENFEKQLSLAVTKHATPVGSGTVARTKRIPINARAEAAVIAWMRHQTTGYDGMKIPRVKGKRREIRRILAQRSKELLDGYRQGSVIPVDCPLAAAIQKTMSKGSNP